MTTRQPIPNYVTLRTLILSDKPIDPAPYLNSARQADYVLDWVLVTTHDEFVARLAQSYDLILCAFSKTLSSRFLHMTDSRYLDGDYETITGDLMAESFDAMMALEILNQKQLDMPFIVVTEPVGEEWAVEFMKRGASDFLLRERLEYLGKSIRQALVAQKSHEAKRRMELALYETQMRLQATLANAPIAMIVCDRFGLLTLIEGTLLEALRMDWQSTIGQSVFMLFKDITPNIAANWRRALNGETFTDIFDFNQGEYLFETQYLPLCSTDGTITGAMVIAHDITQRVAMETAEREQRVMAEVLRDTAATLISTLDYDEIMERLLRNVGRIVTHLSAYIALISGEQLQVAYWRGDFEDITELFQNVYPPLSQFPWLLKIYETGQALILPHFVPGHGKDENSKLALFTRRERSFVGIPIRVHAETIGFLCLIGESNFFTSEHVDRLSALADQAAIAIQNAQLFGEMRSYTQSLEKRVGERTSELQNIKDRVEAILNHTSDGILLMRTNGTIQQTNPMFKTLFGYDDEEVFNRPLTTFIESDAGKQITVALQIVADQGQAQRLEVIARRSDGTTFDADIALSLIAEANTSGIVCSIRDITERKKLENELRASLHKERELRNLKSTFISTVSHEFRTPLAVIMTSTDILLNYADRLPPETQQMQVSRVRKIQGEIKRLTEMIEEVMVTGQFDLDQYKLRRAPLNLIAYCQAQIDEISQSIGRQHHFDYTHSGAYIVYIVDEKSVRQIIFNLLSNGIKYSNIGSTVYIEVQTRIDHFILRVRDEGIGIPQGDQKHLFEMFHRASNVGGIRGMGLGLSIVKQVVDLYGGSVNVVSELGVGTTFTVNIPALPL